MPPVLPIHSIQASTGNARGALRVTRRRTGPDERPLDSLAIARHLNGGNNPGGSALQTSRHQPLPWPRSYRPRSASSVIRQAHGLTDGRPWAAGRHLLRRGSTRRRHDARLAAGTRARFDGSTGQHPPPWSLCNPRHRRPAASWMRPPTLGIRSRSCLPVARIPEERRLPAC